MQFEGDVGVSSRVAFVETIFSKFRNEVKKFRHPDWIVSVLFSAFDKARLLPFHLSFVFFSHCPTEKVGFTE